MKQELLYERHLMKYLLQIPDCWLGVCKYQAQLVEALRYKQGGRGFDFRWCHWNFTLT